MEELQRIRRELAALRAGRTAALWRAHRGLDFDLVEPYRRQPAATHDETPRVIDEALRKAGSEAERDGLQRLRAAVTLERVRVTALRLEQGLRAGELAAVVEGPEGRLPLRAALRSVALEPQRGRRERLADACGRAIAEDGSRRADWIALQQEALGREGTSPALLAGFDQGQLLEEARAVLAATEDAWRELLPWALGRWVAEGLQPVPRGDLAAHDLAWLQAAPFLGAAFPAGALRLAAAGLVEAMGFDGRRGNVRLDLDRRPLAAIGAFVAPIEIPGRIGLSLAPQGTPADWRDLFGGIAAALRFASLPCGPEETWAGEGAVEACFVALFRSIVREPLFYRRVVQAPRAAAEEAVRAFTLLELLELRTLCGRAIYEAEVWVRPPSQAVARSFGEILAAATGVRFDERLFLAAVDPALPACTSLRGHAILGAIAPALLERLDEDWWRNPRTGPLLQGIWARGGALRGAEVPKLLGAGAPSLQARAEQLVAHL
ncbi:hypothetical protein [Vulgatibacter sp.]|uniref:hypothetical protein n=1 Tax=Vulgatibacter sp. TaxID=1971226 RepID=UPI0035699209